MRRYRSGERGASLVELALILPLLALMALGTVDLVRAYRLNIRLENAAREGAALAQVLPNDVDCPTGPDGDVNDIVGRVSLEDPDLASEPTFVIRVSGGTAGSLTEYYTSEAPTPTCESDGGPATISSGERVEVEVGRTFDLMTPLIGNIVGGSIDMTSSAEVEVQT